MNAYVDKHIGEFDIGDKQNFSKIEELIKKIMCDSDVTANSIFKYLNHEYKQIYNQIDTGLMHMGFEHGIINLFIELDR